MDIVPVEAKLMLGQVVSIDVDDGNNQAFRWVLCVFMDPTHVGFERDCGNLLWVEDGNTLASLTIYQICEKFLRDSDDLIQIEFIRHTFLFLGFLIHSFAKTNTINIR